MSPADSPFAQLPAPGPHPPTAELRDYAAGQLAPADEHRIEAHTLDCERCAELVEGFAMSDGATTDRAVAELRTRLQARVGQAEPEPAAGWAWPRIAAAAALLAVVGTGIWGWEQYESADPTTPTARVETTAAPAVSPAAIASKPVTSPAASISSATDSVPVAAAPQANKPAYAAVTSAARRAAPKLRFVPPTAAQVAAMKRAEDAKAAAAATADAPETAATVAGVAQATQAPPISDDNSRDAEVAKADVAPAAKSESAPPSRPATDTMLSLSEVAVAAPAKKMKALVSSAAPAMVPNTPMPAGFAIRPVPVGGTPAFRDYLRREAAQFEPEKEARISGLVHVQFTVGADGQLSNLKVTRGMRADYDEEALRLVCEGPKWQPGIAGGRRAPLVMEFTIPF
ncbi:TonB family protein [Hymenobacter convexus]|uniref:TonB family protein n=1 Tax=Hymenobacter sp. CA1UV-4 TaxID=3063782 RepID=UPI002713F00C|nr:TonB family protein [Hymenobacter sp. CA1UV-4]MDO7850822.1 TonB family protein [Hymenobacter sp. CA1UV-4]